MALNILMRPIYVLNEKSVSLFWQMLSNLEVFAGSLTDLLTDSLTHFHLVVAMNIGNTLEYHSLYIRNSP